MGACLGASGGERRPPRRHLVRTPPIALVPTAIRMTYRAASGDALTLYHIIIHHTQSNMAYILSQNPILSKFNLTYIRNINIYNIRQIYHKIIFHWFGIVNYHGWSMKLVELRKVDYMCTLISYIRREGKKVQHFGAWATWSLSFAKNKIDSFYVLKNSGKKNLLVENDHFYR